jgi:hypothetical protein
MLCLLYILSVCYGSYRGYLYFVEWPFFLGGYSHKKVVSPVLYIAVRLLIKRVVTIMINSEV